MRSFKGYAPLRALLAVVLAFACLGVMPGTAVAAPDGYEPDDTPANAIPIPTDGTIHYKTTDPSGDLDFVSFTAVSGQTYELRTGPHYTSPDENFDTRLILYATDSVTEIGNNDDADWSNYSRITWTAPSDGTYFLRGSYYSLPGPTGRYGVRVRDVTASGVGTITGTVTDASGAPLEGIFVEVYDALGGLYAGTIAGATTGADGTYTIAGIADGAYRVRFVDPAGEYITAFHGGRLYADSTIVNVAIDGTASGVDAQLAPMGSYWPADAQPDPVALFNDPQSSAVDTAGCVYVVERGNDRVQKFDPAGNYLAVFGVGELSDPEGIDVGPDGLVYVADWGNHRIRVYDGSGTWMSDIVGDGSMWPVDVAVSPTGTVMASDNGAGKLWVFLPDGTLVSNAVLQPGGGPGEFNGIAGIDVAPDGLVHAADWGNSRVQVLNQDASYVDEYATAGQPRDVVVVGGFSYVTDDTNQVVGVIDGSGSQVATLGSFGYLEDQFGGIEGISASPVTGNIFIADPHPWMRRISEWSPDSGYVRTIGSEGLDPGRFRDPYGITTTPQGHRLVADTGNNRLQLFNVDGSLLYIDGANGGDGSSGSGAGEFNGPRGLCIDSSYNTYVADTENHRIQKLDDNFDPVWSRGSWGTGNLRFKRPRDIAWAEDGVHAGGVIFVADTGNDRVVVYDVDGNYLGKRDYIDTPEGIAAGPDGLVYVSETNNDRVVVLQWDGSSLQWFKDLNVGGGGPSETSLSGVRAAGVVPAFTGLNEPRGLDVDDDGDIFIADTFNDRIVEVDPDGNVLAVFGVTGYIKGHMDNPSDVGVDSAGRVFVMEKVSERMTTWLTDSVPPTTTSNAVAGYVTTATISLVATDDLSGVAQTYYRLDGGAVGTGTVVTTSTVGTHTVSFWSVDNAGNIETSHTVSFTVYAAAAGYTSLQGADRYGTAIEISKAGWPTGAGTIVVATGENWPDALGGSALAGAVGGPVLLVRSDSVPASVSAEITRLGATKAYVLGETEAISAPVMTTLQAKLGAANITRIGGADRFRTAEKVASETVRLLGTAYDGNCFVATGGTFADALSASPIAYAKRWPVYLSGPTSVASETGSAMQTAGVRNCILLGGEAAITPDTAVTLLNLGFTASRLDGADRYETAGKVAAYGVSNAGLMWDGIGIATGEDFPDALAGGPGQGKAGSVMLLTRQSTLPSATSSKLTANKATIHTVRFFGGLEAISQAVRTAVNTALL